jgi:hypothetical protein
VIGLVMTLTLADRRELCNQPVNLDDASRCRRQRALEAGRWTPLFIFRIGPT